MRITFGVVLTFITALSIGNCAGDQGTIRDCASKGRAIMSGGGSIKCEVVREKGQQ